MQLRDKRQRDKARLSPVEYRPYHFGALACGNCVPTPPFVIKQEEVKLHVYHAIYRLFLHAKHLR
jgi:hypothetical protein